LNRLKRNIRLGFQFYGKPYDRPIGFPVPSTYNPPLIKGPVNVESFLDVFEAKLKLKIGQEMKTRGGGMNLSQKEMKALREICRMKNVIIKPADKGAVTVIMDKSKYLTEGFRQLSNVNFYKPLPESIQSETITKVRSLVDDLWSHKVIDSKTRSYLRPLDDVKNRVFYVLPKIQKKDWPDPKMPAGRPIVTNVGTELTRISQYVDYWIQPLAKNLLKDNLVRDSYDLIERLKALTLPKEADILLVAADVESLYTNIPHHDGINAVLKVWDSFPVRKNQPPRHLLIRAMELILTRNDFEFVG
jgi:hypothetical protein